MKRVRFGRGGVDEEEVLLRKAATVDSLAEGELLI